MPAFRPSRVIIHPDVQDEYDRICSAAKSGRKEESALWRSIQTAIMRIKGDGQWSEVIPTIPQHFSTKYGARNLYCVDLAFFHRGFYTIVDREVILLEVVDHAQYDRWSSRRGK